MKKSILLLAVIISTSLFANTIKTGFNQNPPIVGDTLTILKNSGSTYKHIDFPRLNLIVKRGGIANYKSVHNCNVVITEITEDKTGNTIITLKRADGKKFFNQKLQVTADYEKAILSGELKKINK